MAGDPSNVMWRRVFAYLIDVGVAVVVFVGVLALMGASIRSNPTGVGGAEIDGSAGAVLVASLFPFGYWVVAEVIVQGRLGWTPGKLAMGIRLVGWDGRPPGMLRAFGHSLVINVTVGVLSCLGGALLLAWAWSSRGHRHLGDLLAGTYVVDSWAQGRMMVMTERGLRSGEVTVTRADVAAHLGPEAAARIPRASRAKPGEPVFDKDRNAYVVWRPKQQRWFQFDDSTGTWHPIE